MQKFFLLLALSFLPTQFALATVLHCTEDRYHKYWVDTETLRMEVTDGDIDPNRMYSGYAVKFTGWYRQGRPLMKYLLRTESTTHGFELTHDEELGDVTCKKREL